MHMVRIETHDWVTPLAFIENFIYYAQRECCCPVAGNTKQSSASCDSAFSSVDGQQQLEEEFTSLWRTNSLDRIGHSEQNEMLATFPISIRFFQRPVLSECNRYIYTLGKCVAAPSTDERLRLLRLDLLKLQISSYLSKGFKHLLNTMPGLYCSSNNRQNDSSTEEEDKPLQQQLFLCFNYTDDHACPRALEMYNEDFPDAISPPFKSVCLPPGTGDIVDSSCLFRLVMDDAAHSLVLVHVPVPFPPVKPTRIFWPHGIGNEPCAEMPDNARLLPVILPSTNCDEMCLFTLNTNAKAHLYDGHCWHLCEAEEDDFEKEFSIDAEPSNLIDNKFLFAANNRVFLILANKGYGQYIEHSGKLIEIFVDPNTHTFRKKVLCNYVKFSSIKSVTCSGNKFAVSHFYGWTGNKQSMPEPAPCIGPQKGFVQFLVGTDEE